MIFQTLQQDTKVDIKTNRAVTIIDKIVIPHSAFIEAERRIQQCFKFSDEIVEPEGLAIVGESGVGKTSSLRSFRLDHMPTHQSDGWRIPLLYASVPPQPTRRSLAGAMLAALHDPNSEQGTADQKAQRLEVLMRGTGTRMVMIDEFQHFYSKDKQKTMYDVADWLKRLVDSTRTVLVIAGLPSCMLVVQQNEQLRRRFMNPVRLPRFVWENLEQRREFMAILKEFTKLLSEMYEMPALHTEDMAFRFYCASGGLIGYVAKLLRQAVRNAIDDQRKSIALEDLHLAHMQAIFSHETTRDRIKPFERSFSLVATVEILDRAGNIGEVIEMPQRSMRREARSTKEESLDSMLRAR
jgi:Cdc6-like AAA superfamily ATPase